MKTRIFILLSFLFVFNCNLYSQSGWFLQNVNSSSHLHSIYFPSSNTGYIGGWASEIIKTTDGGNNWFHLSSNPNMDIQCVFFINNDIGWLTGGAGAIRQTTDGGVSWIIQSGGTSGILYSTFFINITTGFIVGDLGKILKTTNGGMAWNIISSGTSYNLTSVYFNDTNTGWVSGDHGTILKTSNGGNNWYSLNIGLTNNLGKLSFINSATGWVTGDNGVILKTTSGGNSWILQQSGTSSWIMTSYFVSPNTGWIGGVSGIILKTTNGGDNWFSQTSNTANQFRSNYFLNQFTGFTVGFYGTVVKTTNGGMSAPNSPQLISPPNNAINQPLTPTMTWSNVGGNYYKIQISTNPTFNIITDSATVTATQYIVPAGKLQLNYTYFWRVNASNTYGTSSWSSTWQFSVNTIGLNPNGTIIPSEFKLYSNYPNPFNPATKIKFDLPKKAFTSLIVYDALGRTVETLVNTELKEGSYEYTWNATKYNSGVYFIRIVSDKYAETRKMLLIK